MNNRKCINEPSVSTNHTSTNFVNFPSCDDPNEDNSPFICYSFWQLLDPLPSFRSLSDYISRNESFLLINRGCISKESNMCGTSRLFSNNSLLLCCCDDDYCNENSNLQFCLENLLDSRKITLLSNDWNVPSISNNTIILICVLILLIVIPIILCYSFHLIRMLLLKKRNRQSNQPEDLSRSNWNRELKKLLTEHDKIEIIEYRTRGRYGNIFKAKLIDKNPNVEPMIVAVKVFQQVDYKSFNNELKIYRLTGFKHDNVLSFIKAEIRTGNLLNIPEYWLITKYQENGSLQDFLGLNRLDQKQIISICLDIASGLAFLHGYGKSNRQIAHRDFKSGNILIDDQLRASIGDFGLGLVFYNHKLETDSLNQVGTIRYLSPELLDGAINFSGDSLLKVDIYACSLVFWEILSRHTELQEQNSIKEYKLPFELELGTMPSINELKNYVSFEQKRPKIELHWYKNEFLNEFCKLIEDCWCADAEKRLTSACIYERISKCN